LGYGFTFLPFRTGEVTLNIPCWRPSNQSSQLSEDLLSETPEFVDKTVVYSVEEKFGIMSNSSGNVINSHFYELDNRRTKHFVKRFSFARS